MTQEQLAGVAGVSTRRVRAIEAGHANATLSTIEALAGALKVEPLRLLR